MYGRIFSTLILWAIAAAAIIFGKTAGWAVLIFLLSAGTLWEVCAILEKLGKKPLRNVLQISNLAVFIGAYLGGAAGAALACSLCAGAIAVSILKDPYGEYAQKTALPSILALACVPLSLQWLVSAGQGFGGEYACALIGLWAAITAKFSDIGAYVMGAAFGRHKMSPEISPNKTWEGAVCGVLSSAIISVVIFGFARALMPAQISLQKAALAGAVLGAVAIVSDLLESAFKRRAGVKDSGAVIPGIGGALDLSDSLLLASPAAALLLILMSI